MVEDKLIGKANYKLDLIKDFHRSGKSITDYCKEKEVNVKTFYRWLNNFNKCGYDGLIEKSKRPKNYKETPSQIRKAIVELSQKLGLGCKNISNTLSSLHTISHTGVLKVLRRNGITYEKERKRWKSFKAPYKNHTWQVDLLGPYSTIVGEISLLVVLDDYSRYSKSKMVPRRGTTEQVKAFLNELIEEQGKPYRILSNHGSQFRKAFDKWCNSKQIKHHRSRVRHPQTLGKVEAVNKMLGKCFRFDFGSLKEGQLKLNTIMLWYNHIHFHSIIESTPAEAYGVQKDKKDVLKERLAETLKLNALKKCLIS